jgi:hypothetical protein
VSGHQSPVVSPARGPARFGSFEWTLLLLVAALTLVSWVIVGQGAGDEPYVRFVVRDALVQIGVAAMLMLLWLQLAGFLVLRIAQKQRHAAWLAVVVWALICEFYLSFLPVGYANDIARFATCAPHL